MMIREQWLLQGATTMKHRSAAAIMGVKLMTAPSFPGIPERQPTWFVESVDEFFERGL